MKTAKAEKDLTADKFIDGLIRRLADNENRMKQMQEQINDLYEKLAETVPWLTEDGALRFRGVLHSDSSDDTSHEVIVPPSAITVTPEENR